MLTAGPSSLSQLLPSGAACASLPRAAAAPRADGGAAVFTGAALRCGGGGSDRRRAEAGQVGAPRAAGGCAAARCSSCTARALSGSHGHRRTSTTGICSE